jgi:hypothetical protein
MRRAAALRSSRVSPASNAVTASAGEHGLGRPGLLLARGCECVRCWAAHGRFGRTAGASRHTVLNCANRAASLRPSLAAPRKRYVPRGKRFLNVVNATLVKGGSLASRNSSLSPNGRRSRPFARTSTSTFRLVSRSVNRF